MAQGERLRLLCCGLACAEGTPYLQLNPELSANPGCVGDRLPVARQTRPLGRFVLGAGSIELGGARFQAQPMPGTGVKVIGSRNGGQKHEGEEA